MFTPRLFVFLSVSLAGLLAGCQSPDAASASVSAPLSAPSVACDGLDVPSLDRLLAGVAEIQHNIDAQAQVCPVEGPGCGEPTRSEHQRINAVGAHGGAQACRDVIAQIGATANAAWYCEAVLADVHVGLHNVMSVASLAARVNPAAADLARDAIELAADSAELANELHAHAARCYAGSP
jgi:hypothetical protein